MNEIKVIGYTAGLTLTAQILDDDLTQVGADITMTEVGGGDYVASVPTLSAGVYSIKVKTGRPSLVRNV